MTANYNKNNKNVKKKSNETNANYRTHDFEIDNDFIEENKKINLVKHRQDFKGKFAPFTKSQRRKRRMEVYKLHFEHGVPATRIADMMNVDRNTINNDLKILYQKALRDYDPDNMSFNDILQKQLFRLETQRDRLGICLTDTKAINDKIAIERLVADIDFKLIGVIERMNYNEVRIWQAVVKQMNRLVEDKKLNVRYTSLFELYEISIDSRKSLNKLREEFLE
ncbi:MAG TPA: hypothetical protein VFM20_02605 [Nitrososphaeraceae archaeon]|nr:hypothetical protein [Nitrososphaeraceae archaeon]